MGVMAGGWVDRVLGLLFPERCGGCGGWGGPLCDGCGGRLRPYPPEAAPEGLDGVTVAFIFEEGPLQAAIHQLKYRRRRRVARPLGALLARRLLAAPQPADCLMAVPLHPGRLAERGFNQAEELARAVAGGLGMPLVAGLARLRDTGHQARLGRRERRANISGAFAWRGAGPPPARVLLIDDVLTTGATLAACAEALRAAGAREVRAAALGRSLLT